MLRTYEDVLNFLLRRYATDEDILKLYNDLEKVFESSPKSKGT